MTSLYSYTQEFLEVKAQLEGLDLDPKAFADTLEYYEDNISDKAENIIKYSDELKAEAEMLKAQAKKFSEAAAKKQKKADSLVSYLDENLKKMDIKELQAGMFKLSYRAPSKVTLVDEALLPKKYFIAQEPVPMSKPELKKLVEAGTKIPGVSIVDGASNLQVKL